MVGYDDVLKNKKLSDFEDLLPVVCPRCGYNNVSSDYSCSNCGYRLKKGGMF
jgi:DNA-directed RNA polymerase subunit RPC12/RpoP